jgi:flagellar motor switch protein FliM
MSSNVLSQSEIDALLGAISTEQPEEPAEVLEQNKPPARIKAYDFRHPDKFSKEHIRSLQLVHESFASQASSSLSAYLRSPVQMSLGAVEQVMNEEYLPRLPDHTVLYIVGIHPLPGRAILQVGLNVCFAMVDRLLGGSGRPLTRPREITEVELSLLERVSEKMLAALADAWSSVLEIDPQVEEVVLSPQFMQEALPNDALALFTLELKIGEVTGVVTLALPYPLLEPIIYKLSTRLWFASVYRGAGAANDGARLARMIEKVRVPVQVELGAATVTVRELTQLATGDILFLESSPGEELSVLVGHRPRFHGRPGLLGNKLGVEITAVVNDELEGESGESL